MSLYSDLAAVTIAQLAEFGRDIVVTHQASSYNITTGTVTDTPTTATHKGLVSLSFGRLLSDFRIVGNASTIKEDICVIFGSDVTVEDDALLTFDGRTYSIFRIDKVAPGGTLVLQRVWVRQ